MRIELLNKRNEGLFDSYLKQHEDAMLYYSLKYRDLVASITSAEPRYYLAIENEKITGILPLMQKEGKLGKVINSLPFYGSHGGVIADDEETKKRLLDHYIEIVSDEDISAATLIENPFSSDNQLNENIPCNEKDFRIGQLTNIDGDFTDLEDLMTKFHYKTRNTIRKSLKSDVKISVENDMFKFLEDTHKENMDSIGGLAKSHTFFELTENLFEANHDFKIYVARYEGQPIAALLNFYYGNVVEYFTPVIVKEFRNLQSLSLLIAQAMLDASQNGFKWWNWGGTWSSQEGVYKFKSRWGTSDFNYNYYTIINNKEIYNSSKEVLLEEYAGFYVLPFDKLVEK